MSDPTVLAGLELPIGPPLQSTLRLLHGRTVRLASSTLRSLGLRDMTGLTKPAKNYVNASSKLYHDACTMNTIYFIILPNNVFINILPSSFNINCLILLCTKCLFYKFSIIRQLFSNSSHEVTKQTSDV